MPFYQSNGLRYYKFDSLMRRGVTHAVFTRQGGVSPHPWTSLNVGGTVGDEVARVIENRHRSFHALGKDPGSIHDVWQVHGSQVVFVEKPRPQQEPYVKADVMLCDRPEVGLFMRFADCVPILLFDPKVKVVGLVHTGWQGTVRRAAEAAVNALQAHYRCHPGDILAAIGPSIGPHHYEVGPEVVDQVEKSFHSTSRDLLESTDGDGIDGKALFDLWKANRLILEESGVRQIEVCEICTACHPEDWYSHRGEGGQTGRFGALFALEV